MVNKTDKLGTIYRKMATKAGIIDGFKKMNHEFPFKLGPGLNQGHPKAGFSQIHYEGVLGYLECF